MSLSDLPAPQQQSSWTDELPGTLGEFQISSVPIRYFMTSVPLSALSRCFTLVEDVPGSENWGYNAIFQRDIDEDRVQEELLDGYLLQTDKFKFFNPLTIALLPYDRTSQTILDNYREPFDRREEGNLVAETLDGIRIKSLRTQAIGHIQWDTDRVFGLAIDGQHRLSALIEFAKAPTEGIDPTACPVPIILLVFNRKRGEIVKQIREIFIDINKTAQPVSKARQILLDDRDLFAIMARDLIADDTSASEGLPYEVVDWRKDSIKPDSPQQLTNVIVLYECVKNTFGKRPRNADAQLDVNNLLRARALGQVDFRNTSCIENRHQSQMLLERFRARHKVFMLKVLRDVEIYSQFLGTLKGLLNALQGSALREYLFKPEKKRPPTKERLQRSGVDVAQVIDGGISKLAACKDEKNILIYSVGQRGLFAWAQKTHSLYREHLETESYEQTGSAYVEDLNRLSRKGFFLRDAEVDGFRIWESVCLQSGAIQWSAAAANRIGALILLACAAIRLGVDTGIHETRAGRSLRLDSVRNKIVPIYASRIAVEEEAYEDYEEEYQDGEDEEWEAEEAEEETEQVEDFAKTASDRLDSILRWARTN